jgi:hypothetical protein
MSFYGTVAEADAYHLARGNTAWTGDNALKEAALTRGSDYIDQRYRVRSCGGWASVFPGERTGGRAQEREWPRTGATDWAGNEIPDTEIPIEVKHATFEAALRELIAPGSLSPDFVPSAARTKVKVDVIEVTYASPQDGDSPPNRPVIPMIDEIIAPLTFRSSCGPAVFVV